MDYSLCCMYKNNIVQLIEKGNDEELYNLLVDYFNLYHKDIGFPVVSLDEYIAEKAIYIPIYIAEKGNNYSIDFKVKVTDKLLARLLELDKEHSYKAVSILFEYVEDKLKGDYITKQILEVVTEDVTKSEVSSCISIVIEELSRLDLSNVNVNRDEEDVIVIELDCGKELIITPNLLSEIFNISLMYSYVFIRKATM